MDAPAIPGTDRMAGDGRSRPFLPGREERWDEQDEDGVALRRLRWRARRGMLENDVLLARLFDRHAAKLDARLQCALERLLQLPDGELLDLALGRAAPPDALDTEAGNELLALLRSV